MAPNRLRTSAYMEAYLEGKLATIEALLKRNKPDPADAATQIAVKKELELVLKVLRKHTPPVRLRTRKTASKSV